MKLKKRYIALIAFALFSAYNGYKGWHDTKGQEEAFGLKPSHVVQKTPGKTGFSNEEAKTFAAKLTELSQDQDALEKIGQLCEEHHVGYQMKTCQDFALTYILSESYKTIGVSMPQFYLHINKDDLSESSTKHTAGNKQFILRNLAAMQSLVKTKSGSELLVINNLVTEDEVNDLREFFGVKYEDKPTDYSQAKANTGA